MRRTVVNTFIQSIIGISASVVLSLNAWAGELNIPHEFVAGSKAKAAEVNDNFDAVKQSVDDNHGRITILEANDADPDISGNITLVPSTPTTGNILKGTDLFLHNYGADNTFLGKNAGNLTMTGGGNTGHGAWTLNSNSSGDYNTASGSDALTSNTSGAYNTASGALALFNNTSGIRNTASGMDSLFTNITGEANTAVGYQALYLNEIGDYNTACGARALQSNVEGNYNTAVGGFAMHNNTGNSNIGIGYSAGYNLTTGINNIVIDNAGVAGESYTIRIGDNQSRTFISGIRGVTTDIVDAIQVVVDSDGQLGTVSSSRRVKDAIKDMGTASDVLKQLRPVTFYYKSDLNPKGRTLKYGLIAEEVAEVAPQLVAHSKSGEIETVYYQYLSPMLLNEYQKQQRTIEKQAVRITQLEQQIRDLLGLKQQVMDLKELLYQWQSKRVIAKADQP